jgi:hypothetical protein
VKVQAFAGINNNAQRKYRYKIGHNFRLQI